jgi:hypothetical protein
MARTASSAPSGHIRSPCLRRTSAVVGRDGAVEFLARSVIRAEPEKLTSSVNSQHPEVAGNRRIEVTGDGVDDDLTDRRRRPRVAQATVLRLDDPQIPRPDAEPAVPGELGVEVGTVVQPVLVVAGPHPVGDLGTQLALIGKGHGVGGSKAVR